MGIHIERVTTLTGCEICRALAAEVWGVEAACSTPQMVVHAEYGGVLLLAREDQHPVGFSFGFPARYRGEWVLWSHETAVVPAYLHKGVGYELKRTQQRIAREMGYTAIAWTFDPLVARNGYFNLVKLGARVAEYKRNAYGADPNDLVNRGMETDRFVALWPTAGAVHKVRLDSSVPKTAARVLSVDTALNPTVELEAIGEHEFVITEIPEDFGGLIATRRDQANAWRLSFRRAAETLLASGWRPVTVVREPGCVYYVWFQQGE